MRKMERERERESPNSPIMLFLMLFRRICWLFHAAEERCRDWYEFDILFPSTRETKEQCDQTRLSS